MTWRDAGMAALCDDDELGYRDSRTRFGEGDALLLDENYRLAHLPLIAPRHARVIARQDGKPYDMGRRGRIFSLVMPVPAEALRRSVAGRALEAELRASPFAHKIAWNILEQRRNKLHATICGSLASGETAPRLGVVERAALARLGPLTIELRGLFSGNVNLGRLYLRVYPEKRDGLNMFHHIQRIMGCRETNLYVVGIYNLIDDLDSVETSALAKLIDQWWDEPILRFQAEVLWLLGADDDLVLRGAIAESVRLG